MELYGNNITIQNGSFGDFGNQAIFLQGNNGVIQGSVFNSTGTNSHIYLLNDYHVVRNNLFDERSDASFNARISGGSSADYLEIYNNTFNGCFGVYAEGRHQSIYDNVFENQTNTYGSIYLKYATDSNIYDNEMHNGKSTVGVEKTNRVNITGNNMTNLTTNTGWIEFVNIIDSNHTLVNNNYLDFADTGVLLRHAYNTTITNNTLLNMMTGTDAWSTAIRLEKNNSGTVITNNYLHYGKRGVLVRKSDDTHIYNNSFDEATESELDSVPTHNHYDFPSAVAVLEVEEGYNTVDDSWSDATNNLSLNQQLQSTGVFIADNTYDSDTETYLQLQGASNVTHDFSDYWYRKFQADTNYFDPMEFFIKNSVSYLTNVNHYQNEGNISRIARGGNFGNLMFNYTIKQSNSTWLMINDSETYELKLFNLTEPNNDIINLSDGSVLEYSASSYAINLSYGGGISLVSYADTVDPFWLQTPINISWDNATSLSIQYNASDDVLVDKYFMNESTYFSLTDTGLFTNNSGVSEGNYSINISVNDTSGNSISEVFTIEVLYTDVSLPIWLQTPTNFSSSNESAILVDYNASDDVAIDEYWVDNANFSINSSGYFQNATILSLGNYSVNISVNDSANNVLSEVIVVTIYHDDVTVPIWTVEPVDINVYSDELVGEQYSASDNVAIDSYYLNDSTNFVINSSGYFKNSSSLVVGTYNVLISVNDTDNNTISKAITITITTRPTSAPVGGGGG